MRRNLVAGLYFLIGLLLVANLVFAYNEIILERHFAIASQFFFDRRLNIPFFFSVILLIINLLFLFRISIQSNISKSQKIFWTTLFIIFFLFTLDEVFYIHQHFKMSTFGSVASYDQKSWTHYLWVIPYFGVFGILIGVLFKYSAGISGDDKKKLLIAGAVFLLGAVVMEFAGTFYAVMRPGLDFNILLIKSAEGVLQLVGSVMFLDCFYRTRHRRLDIF